MKVLIPLTLALPLVFTSISVCAQSAFRAGAANVDISPTKFPVVVNGNFLETKANAVLDPLHARAIVLDDGKVKLAIVVVDNCLMPRELLDEAKKLAEESTGIPTDRILISATHTHSAPSVMGCLGSGADPEYPKFLVSQLSRSIHLAHQKLQPARIGWAKVEDSEHTYCRRWIYRPDRMLTDPFGNVTVRANMHPGHQNPNAIGPSGPVDPDLSLLAIQTRDGKPLAVLANYSMHYYGTAPVSADYYGRFCDRLRGLIGQGCVTIMSQGTSGDQMWMDYGAPAGKRDIDAYAAAVAKSAHQAYQNVQYHDGVTLAMKEVKLTLGRRLADAERLAWAKKLEAQMKDGQPKSRPEIYAREVSYLEAEPRRELKLQAIRIGDVGMTAMPNEVFAITGLKLKQQSPLPFTVNFSLANGADGYIPPPEQHKLGGYTTWPARTAGLEVGAEPKIVDTMLTLLEQVAEKPRRKVETKPGAYAQAVLAAKPEAYFRLEEIGGEVAHDAVGKHQNTRVEDGVARYLDGPAGPFSADGVKNRAMHFAGGRIHAHIKNLPATYSVEMWFWNGLPNDARQVTGYLFSRGAPGDQDAGGDHLAIGGTARGQGRLLFFNGNKLNEVVLGTAEIQPKTWNHIVLIREGGRVTVFLNGNPQPDLAGAAQPTYPKDDSTVFLGGRNDNFANFEGKLDEVSIYARVLTQEEVQAHYQASGRTPAQPATGGPKSTEDSRKCFQLPAGLKIELVAAEPDVQSPVAMAFDEKGRLFVVEMLDYPHGPAAGKPAEGRIRLLERDATGRYRATGVFADQLLFGNGVMPWKDGVLVTSAPHVLHITNPGSDPGTAKKTILYTGFSTGNPQLRVSHPQLAFDGNIVLANGLRGGKIVRGDKPGMPIDIGGRDFQFDLLKQTESAVTGMGQFGNTFDDWGQRFVCSNRNHWVHMVMPENYLKQNPYLAPLTPHRDNQGPGGSARIYPLTKQVATFTEHVGSFTAACGVHVYRGDLLSDAYRGCIYTCDPTGNLVHQEVLLPKGATFEGRPSQNAREFLASTDEWCRPVFLCSGPDGALYVVDMYRKIIEHPEWMPAALRNSPDLVLGKNHGRIWRIAPEKHVDQRSTPLDFSTSALVALLEHPNGWWRTTAHRLLLEQQDSAAEAPLRKLVEASQEPLARVHAAWVLAHLGKLTEADTLHLLRHPHVRVREHGLRLAEPVLPTSEPARAEVAKALKDTDGGLRFQALLSVGAIPKTTRLELLAQNREGLLDLGDSWTRLALLSSLGEDSGALLTELLPSANEKPTALSMIQELSAAVGARQSPADLVAVLKASQGIKFRGVLIALRRGLAEGTARRGSTLAALIQKLPESDRPLADQLNKLADAGLALARDGKGAAKERLEAIRQLAQLDYKQVEPVLLKLLASEEKEVRLAALRSFGSFAQPEATPHLLHTLHKQADLRSEAIGLMLVRPERTLLFLAEMEAGRVTPAAVAPTHRALLLGHPRSDIRDRSRRLFQGVATAQRKQVLEKFQESLKLTGDPERGKMVFQKARCVECHRVGDLGHTVGPELSDLRTKTPAMLLVDVLDPNAAIDANFVNYVVSLKDGRILTGMIAAETAASITLKRSDQQVDVVLRQDVEDMENTRLSLMPEGLENGLSTQDVADLLVFLKQPKGP